jgi:hypothetical protein
VVYLDPWNLCPLLCGGDGAAGRTWCEERDKGKTWHFANRSSAGRPAGGLGGFLFYLNLKGR